MNLECTLIIVIILIRYVHIIISNLYIVGDDNLSIILCIFHTRACLLLL